MKIKRIKRLIESLSEKEIKQLNRMLMETPLVDEFTSDKDPKDIIKEEIEKWEKEVKDILRSVDREWKMESHEGTWNYIRSFYIKGFNFPIFSIETFTSPYSDAGRGGVPLIRLEMNVNPDTGKAENNVTYWPRKSGYPITAEDTNELLKEKIEDLLSDTNQY